MFPIAGMCAGKALTVDCSVAADEINSAKIQFGVATPVDAPLVSTCGSGADKVTCTDPKSKTICYPDNLWPMGAFTAKVTWANTRAESPPSLPLAVPGIPSSPSLPRTVNQ